MVDELPNRKHLLFRNGIYSVLSWLLPLFLALVVTPIIVKGLGHEMYGLYAVILGFISYSFTFAIGKTATKYVAEYRAAGQSEKISEMVSAILWISMGFGLFAVAIVGLTGHYIVVNILQISPDLQKTAVIALNLASINILIIMLSQVFQFAIQGVQRFDRFFLLTNSSGLLLSLGSVAIVLSGFGVEQLLLWNCVVLLVMGILFYASAVKMLPEFKLKVSIKSNFWRDASRYSLSIITYQVFGNVLMLFERAWLVRKFGTESITFYVLPLTLCLNYHAFASSLVIVLFPVVNELLADRTRLVRLYRTSMKIILTLTAFFVVSSIVSGKVFLNIWMNDEIATHSYPILVLHVITFAIVSTSIIPWQITESFKAAGLNAVVSIMWLAISVPLMIVFSGDWQSSGVALARLIGVVVYLPLIFYVERKILGGITMKFWPPIVFQLGIAALCAGAVQFILLRQLTVSWFTLGVVAIAGLAIYLAALFATGFFEEEEKRAIMSLIRRFQQA